MNRLPGYRLGDERVYRVQHQTGGWSAEKWDFSVNIRLLG